MATLKGENARAADDATAQYQQYPEERERVTERQMTKLEEGRARWEAEASKADETGAAILEYFKNTPYRTKNRDTE